MHESCVKGSEMKAPNCTRIIERKRYSTETATLIANNAVPENNTTKVYLYRTINGAFFSVKFWDNPGECPGLEPISTDEAIEMYQLLPIKTVKTVDLAFPDIEITDA